MIAAFSDDDEFVGDVSLKEYPSKVKYIVDLFGPSDLSKINLSAGPSEIVDNFTAEDIESYSKLYSPINYIKEDLPDTLIIHSKKDNIVPYDTSVELYESGIELNNKFDFYTLENCTHYLENLSNKEALGLYMNIIDFILSESK